jgi:pimeloyl-ACP methyl ester carboxylesterase
MGSREPLTIRRGLAVYRIGDGEPVLLMPGPHRFQRPGLRSADALIDGLVDLGRTVVTFDPPGSGRSSRPADLGMAEMHGCAAEALDACEVSDPVDALGHSMAGLVLLAHLLEHPAQLRRVVLVGTGSGGPAYMNAPGALWNRGHPSFPAVAVLGSLHLLVRRRGSELALTNLIERRSYYDPALAQAERISPRDWLRPAQGHAHWHTIARRIDLSPRLGEVTRPVLVLCGRHDPQFPPSCSRQLAAEIPGSRIVEFPDSGHFPFIEEPGPFWREVSSFLG